MVAPPARRREKRRRIARGSVAQSSAESSARKRRSPSASSPASLRCGRYDRISDAMPGALIVAILGAFAPLRFLSARQQAHDARAEPDQTDELLLRHGEHLRVPAVERLCD